MWSNNTQTIFSAKCLIFYLITANQTTYRSYNFVGYVLFLLFALEQNNFVFTKKVEILLKIILAQVLNSEIEIRIFMQIQIIVIIYPRHNSVHMIAKQPEPKPVSYFLWQ